MAAIGLTCLLGVAGPSWTSAQPAGPRATIGAAVPKGTDKIGPGVRETLQSEGSVRVMVVLVTPASLKRPNRTRFSDIRRDVEAEQNAVIGQLAAGDHNMRRKYRMTPALAVDVHSEKALDRLARHPFVVKIDLDQRATVNLAESIPLIRADSMHAHGYTGKGVVVAILDTGIDTDHPDLADDLIHEECFLIDGPCPNGQDRQSGPGAAEDDYGHGTHVAGIITSGGIVSSVGVAPDAQIVAIKILNGAGYGWSSDIIAGLDWILDNRPDVNLINMSLGAKWYLGECDLADAVTSAFSVVVKALRAVGVTTFASSGNDSDGWAMGAPACVSGVISVAASNDQDELASFSNTNDYTDLVAPGVGIISDLPGGISGSASGTSMASPHAVGCAALQIEAGRATEPGQIEAWLKTSGVPVTDMDYNRSFPRVDCFAEPSFAANQILATAGPPDATGGCGGTGTYTLNIIGGTISRISDDNFNNWAVGYHCWKFDDPYVRVYIVADDPWTFDQWTSPSGHAYLLDGYNGTSSGTIETSFNLLGESPSFEAVYRWGDPTPDLMRLNTVSGLGSKIAPLSGGSSTVYPALALDPSTNILYAGSGDGTAVLHTVNPVTGALTSFGPAGSGITRIAAMDFRSDGTLFASVKVGTGGGPGANYLATISTSTGAATLIGSFGTCAERCSIEGMGAVAFDDGDILYGALHERAQNGTPGLYTINTSTGTATFVTPILDGSSQPLSGGVTSLLFADGVLYGGTAVSKSPIGDGGWVVTIDKTTGEFSRIGVMSATGGRGLTALAPPLPRPVNDDLADAIGAGGLPYFGSGNNGNATGEPSEAVGSCSSDRGNSIWWSFTPSENGRFEVNTNGSGINTGVSVWTGSAFPLDEVGCDDDAGEDTASKLRFDAVAGREYFIRVIGAGGNGGAVSINILSPVYPVNDDIENAIAVGSLPATLFGTNVDASSEPQEQMASCGPDAGTAVWWSFTAPKTGPIDVHTEGSDFNTLLGVWTGSGHPLNEITCNDDFDFGTGTVSWLSFLAVAGQTYYIRVSGHSGEEGNIALNVTDVVFDCTVQSEIPTAECEALADFFDSTEGPGWTAKTGWKITNTPCSWYGITCEGGRVDSLVLRINNLRGSLPESLGNLSGLRVLDLYSNRVIWPPYEIIAPGIGGSLPQSLGNMASLRVLNLQWNNLTGPIPESAGDLSELRVFNVGSNALNGPIPESLGDLSNLSVLNVESNGLTGTIPEVLGGLSKLTVLKLGSNGLDGQIPSSLGNLSNLQELWLFHNNLGGPIPLSLSRLQNLKKITLAYNGLRGTVPLPVASMGSQVDDWCFFNFNSELCVPDIPQYEALASDGRICGLLLDHDCNPVINVDAKVFLQGPYSGGKMRMSPEFTSHCPREQPYSNPIFDNTPLGHDNPDVVPSPPDSVIDWVLVSLRSNVGKSSIVPWSVRVAFVLANGSIVDTSGGILAFPRVPPGPYRLLVRHRNHLAVLSSDTLDTSDGYGSWDFTTSMSQAYSNGGQPMKDLGDGKVGMFACDLNADGQITALDFNLWLTSTTKGEHGYMQADCNLDSHVTALDFNDWIANTTAGASSQVPE